MMALVTWSVLAIIAQAAPISAPSQGGVAPDAKSVQIQSVWDFIIKGGPVMIPIGICSFIALTVIVERLLSLRRSAVIPAGFVSEVRAIIAKSPQDRAAAMEFCCRSVSPIAAIFETALKRLDQPRELLEKHIGEAGERVVARLRKYLRALSVIGSIAPLLGLLGTILGMITAFETVAASGEALGRTELLAKGIYEAMITTAGGLVVAIPVVVMYHWLNARIDTLVAEMDQITMDFVDEFMHPAQGVVPVASTSQRALTPVRETASIGGIELAAATA